MNRLRTRACALASVLVMSMAAAPGCQGLWNPRDDGPRSDEYRVEAEMVPNATLVREDTPAEHPLGRHAFIADTDRLLVLTRITSWEEKPPGQEKDDKAPMIRKDRIMERAWFTLPPDLPMGKELRMDEMRKRFLLGYDEGRIEDGFYIQPFQMEGKMVLLEIKGDSLVVDMDVNIRSKTRTAWRVNGIIEAKVTANGIRATKAVSDRARKMGRASGVVAPFGGGNLNAVNMPLNSATQPSGSTRPASGAAPTVGGADAFMGKWTSEAGGYRYQFQFENAARFLFTSQKPGDAASMGYREGTYEYKGNYLILHVLRYELNGADKIADMATTHLVMRIEWDGNTPTLDGDLKTHEGRVRLPLKQATFDDMRVKKPAP